MLEITIIQESTVIPHPTIIVTDLHEGKQAKAYQHLNLSKKKPGKDRKARSFHMPPKQLQICMRGKSKGLSTGILMIHSARSKKESTVIKIPP